ncbi:hypothetical protein [Microbacterium sp. LMI1-1-1.1]|uniref:hypothetical protein n=1 Tax=unclassified Microbacterium TaxID=2609290 RepID=UPI003467E577
MGVKTAVTAGAVGAAAGLAATALIRKKSGSDSVGDGRHPEGWKAVTILGDADDFTSGGYPAPLQRLADELEIRIAPAPGDKGFEVHARRRTDASGKSDDDADAELRTALRDAKQLFETGEILLARPRPHGHRPMTLPGLAVDKAEDKAKGEGVL